jgi:hypothetical protein
MRDEDDERARWENRTGRIACISCKAVWTEEQRKVEQFWGVVCDKCGMVLCEKCKKHLRRRGCGCGGLLLSVPTPLLARGPTPLSRLAAALRLSLRVLFVVALVCLSGWVFDITANTGERALAPLPQGTTVGVGGIPECVVCRRPATRILASQAEKLLTHGSAQFEVGDSGGGLYCGVNPKSETAS